MADLKLLEELRKEIDFVDDAILDLLRKRMDIAEQIGQAKGGDPVLDPVREKEVILRLERKGSGIEPEYLR
ncbi:MAG TPA: chorismate mutase, partial [Synergistales bacterium]|nr:chorismate mutase [Synergistales bacterium]